MTVAADTKREEQRRNLFVFLFSVVSGISAGWLNAHINLFDKTRFQVLHSMYSGFPFSPLFMASVLLGVFIAPLAANLLSQRGYTFWSLLPPAIWLGFGIDWIRSHIIRTFMSDQIVGLASWLLIAVFIYVPGSFILYRIRLRQRRLAASSLVENAGHVWPPPPGIP